MTTAPESGPRLHFFIGKGGVGKSTISALTAMNCSLGGQRTLLVSMDPAHNQRDIFEIAFSETPRRVNSHLQVREIDTDLWTRRVIVSTRDRIKRTYSYHSAFNLDRCLNILELSPGLEEQALTTAFQETITQTDGYDQMVFDMPPTALSLRFFSMPSLNLAWLKELLALRNRINEKRQIITRIKLPGKTLEQDRIKQSLESLAQSSDDQQRLFSSDRSKIHLVVNPEPLSISEAVRFREKLQKIDLAVSDVILNKVTPGEQQTTTLTQALPGLPILPIPLSDQRVCGLPAISRFLESFDSTAFPVA